MASLLEVSRKYGLNKKPTTPSNVNRYISNYQTRITDAGQEAPAPKSNSALNVLFKALELLDRPRNALFNAAEDYIKGENGIVQGLSEGFTGKEKYYGSDLLKDVGVQNKYIRGLGGFGVDVVADPTNLVTLGAGSLAKGFLTGTGKTLTKESAEALSRAAFKELSETTLRKSAEGLLKRVGKEATTESIESIATRLAAKRSSRVLGKVGASLDDASGGISDILSRAQGAYTAAELTNNARQAGQGLSVAGNTILSNAQLQDTGAAASRYIRDNTGVVGQGFGAVQDFASRIFNPGYVQDLGTDARGILKNFQNKRYSAKNAADRASLEKTMRFAEAAKKAGVDVKQADESIRKVLEGAVDIDDVNEALRDVIREMQSDFKSFAKTEGLPKTRQGYFPHIAREEALKEYGKKFNKGGLTEKLKLDIPSGRKRKIMGTVDQANGYMKFRTSTDAAQQEFVQLAGRELYNDPDAAETFFGLVKKIAKDTKDGVQGAPTYDDLIALMKDDGGLLDGIDNFFETSAVKAYTYRALQNNKILADREFLDNITAALGQRVTKTSDVWKYTKEGYDVVIPKSYLNVFGLDTQQAIAANTAVKQGMDAGVERVRDPKVLSVIKQIVDDSPEAFVKLNGNQFDALQKSGIFAQYGVIEAYAMPKGTIDYVNKAASKQVDAGLRAVGQAVDKFYGIWKPTVTGLRPDYHMRNFFGSNFNNMLDIGMKTFDPKLQSAATKIARNADDTIELGGKQFTLKQIRDEMAKRGASSGLQINEFADEAVKKRIDTALESELAGGGIKGKLKTAAKRPDRALSSAGQAVGEFVETQVRAVNFMANVEKGLDSGMTIEQAYEFATEMVNRVHFNYHDLSQAERQVIRRVLPFYTWARKNIPLQLETFLNDPAKYTPLRKASVNMENALGIDSSNMPEWMQSQLPIPIASDGQGNDTYFTPSLPAADLNNLAEPLKMLMSMLSPAAKFPIEAYTNQQLLNRAPIYTNEYEKAGKLFEHFINQFGIARDVSRVARAAPTGGAIRPVTGNIPVGRSLLKVYNEAEGAEDAAYDYNRQLGNFVQYLKDQGIDVQTLNEINRQNQLQSPQNPYEKYNARFKRISNQIKNGGL